MTTIRTLRKLTRATQELEQLTRALSELGAAGEALAPMAAKLREAARPAPVKGRIERTD